MLVFLLKIVGDYLMKDCRRIIIQIELMLQSQSSLEQDIERSLDRLKIVIRDVSAVPSIPAFYYTASLLNQYAKLNGPDLCRCDFFEEFKTLIQQFGNHDFSQIVVLPINQKKHHQAIIDDILQIVDSVLFINCLRPDIRSSRGQSMRKQYEELANEETEMLLAKSKYKFNVNPNEASEAFKKNHKSTQDSPTKTHVSFYLNQFDEIWELAERSYQEHNIDEAFRKASEYVEKVSKKMQIPKNRQKIIDTITEEYMTMTSFYEEFDKPGWEFDKEDNGITLEYKVYEEEKMIAIRINGEFAIPAVEFLAIIGEIDLMGEYVPFCYDCKEMKVLSRNERIGTSKIYIPLLSDRETYFYAVGYDRMKETGSLFLYSKTINEDVAFQQKYQYQVPAPTEKYVRLEYKFFIVEYIPLSNGRAKIRLASKIDMKMNFLPLFILNKSARIFAFDYFKNILEKVKNYKGSAWQKKVAERPDMYQFFYKKIGEYLKK